MNRRKHEANPQKSALLDDLESIRTLLADDGNQPGPDPAVEDEVPVLDDVVAEETIAAPEAGQAVPAGPTRSAGPTDADWPVAAPAREPGLDDDLFRALLSDEWRTSASDVLQQARDLIGAHGDDWSPAETDLLTDALKVRIDATVQGWMRGMVITHMADLHTRLREALSEELERTIDHIIDQRSSETPDGQ